MGAPLANAQAQPAAAQGTTQGTAAAGNGPVDKRIKREFGFHEPEPLDFDDHTGYVQIFDGISLGTAKRSVSHVRPFKCGLGVGWNCLF